MVSIINKKINKKEVASISTLVERVSESTRNTKNQVGQIINSFLEEINDALVDGEEIRLLNSFTLKTQIKEGGKGKARNPKTGEITDTVTKWVPKCKFSTSLKARVAERKV